PANLVHEGPAGGWPRYLTPETEIEHRSDTQIHRGDPAVRGPVDPGQGGRQRSHDQERRENIVTDVSPGPERNEHRQIDSWPQGQQTGVWGQPGESAGLQAAIGIEAKRAQQGAGPGV